MDKKKQSIAVAKLHYEADMSQQQIAEKLYLSRPTVSRLLQYAKEMGYVEIRVRDIVESMSDLEARLKRKYALDLVKVAPAVAEILQEQKKAMGQAAAELLSEMVTDGDIIGVGWGSTLYEMACRLPKKYLQDVTVVQLKGGISLNSKRTYAHEILELCAQAFGAVGRYLPLPVMFDTVKVKQIVERDKFIAQILDLGKKADIAVFTVGPASKDSTLFHLGYCIEAQEVKALCQRAVGDICSHFYDENGAICDANLDARTVGISLDDLKNKPKRLLVAGGHHKVEAIKAALLGKFSNALVTDRYTAELLLR